MKTYTNKDIDNIIKNLRDELRNEQQGKFRRFVVFMVILCLIISGITGVASYTLAANQIAYTPKDTSWSIDNTQDAIDELRDTVGYALVGSVFSYMGNYAPFGYLTCDGTEYNIADYPRLAEHIKRHFGSYNYFGGNGSTTFAVPNLTGKFLKGYTTAGVNEEAGLPNIKGSGISTVHYGTSSTNWSNNGAFRWYTSAWYLSYTKNASGTHDYEAPLEFDASLSNSIYGKSTTVTPENTSVLYIIKY